MTADCALWCLSACSHSVFPDDLDSTHAENAPLGGSCFSLNVKRIFSIFELPVLVTIFPTLRSVDFLVPVSCEYAYTVTLPLSFFASRKLTLSKKAWAR